MADLSAKTNDVLGRPLRLAIGLGLLLAGVMALAAGIANVGADAFVALGLGAEAARNAALGLGAVVPPLVLVGVLHTIDAPGRYQSFAAAGAGLTAVGIVVGLVGDAVVLDEAAVVVYALGILLALLALAGSVVGPDASGARTSTPSFYRSTVGHGPRDGVTPADGGEEDDDLTFPLDDDR